MSIPNMTLGSIGLAGTGAANNGRQAAKMGFGIASGVTTNAAMVLSNISSYATNIVPYFILNNY